MPIGIMPISGIAEFVGISAALLFSALMLVLSMVALGYWFPLLKRLDKGHGPDALTVESPHQGFAGRR